MLPLRRVAIVALAAASAACSHEQMATAGHDALVVPGQTVAAAERGAAEAGHVALIVPGHAIGAVNRAMSPPQLAPVVDPAPLTGGMAQTMPMPQNTSYEAAGPNSLWHAGSRNFFNDQRASRVGDILTVNIEIADKAEVSNSSNRSRTGTTAAGVTNFFGLEHAVGQLFNSHFDAQNMVNATGTSTAAGVGAINREEKIHLTVAAVIVDRLPNGNLVIAGRQQVLVNAEMRELTVSGVIRPEDIAADNTINHTQIAEARIEYGGRGQLSAVQRPGWGQRIADAITPW